MEIVAGKAVSHQANPGRLGILTGRKMEAMFLMAEVNWGNQREYVDVSQLVERDPTAGTDPDAEVREGRYGTLDDLRRRITFEKLRGLLTDVFYSMKASEIDFYPHQFKPVLRFIDSATNRLLIADEVGLGKTIEAGLIWTEWQARQKARRLLVVCPPTLCPKWLRELQDRFQLPAEPAEAKSLAELLDRFDRKGPGLSFVRVASYHSLRPLRTERAQLQELRDSPPDPKDPPPRLPPRVRLLHRLREWDAPESFFDMVVFDEMHAMKETGTAAHFLGEILTSAAAAMVGLSATPIHNKTRDLYALLHLVDPEVFRDELGFDDLRRQNLPIVQLQNALAAPDWRPEQLLPLINSLQSREARDKFHTLLNEFDGSPRKRVEFRHTAERSNLLGNFINRTRKSDVLENRVLRQPATLQVILTKQEATLYTAVLALVRKAVQRRGDALTSFHLIHPALRMSSSLPTIAEDVRQGKWGGFEEMENLAEDFGQDLDPTNPHALPSPDQLRGLADFDFEKHDSKYAALLQALRLIRTRGTLSTDNAGEVTVSPSEKVIIFAFFKSTIAYLHRRLKADGFPGIAVTGDITDRVERDKLLQEFASDDNRILLCSEIGAEGVDLQFARIVVNYDLPWNPMRVEQRIGRIDRIGQESPTVIIINFHVRDTIDGSIFSHLYEKIGVFEHTIGALEGILGEEIAKLTSQIFREDLTPDQIALRAAQTADAVCQRAAMEQQLENSTGALIAFQDLLSEQIGESQRLGRFIKPAELRLHTQDFFATKYQGSSACLLVADNPAPECLQIKLSFQALSDFESFCQLHDHPWPYGFSRSTRTVTLTFDPAIHQRLKRRFPQLVLTNHLHPFFRWITKLNEQANNEWHKVSAVRLTSHDFSPGRYFYLVYRMSLEGITRRDAFYYSIKHLPSDEILIGTRAESLFNLALDSGESAFLRETPDYLPHLASLRAAISEELKAAQRMFREDQAQKLSIRRQQVTAHFSRRIADQQRRILTAEQGGPEARRGLAGFRRQLANLQSERDQQLAKLDQKSANLQGPSSEVACGIIDISTS
jgi:SNF2 family DNA or RNA helicase